jgi:hypothetical protein
MYVVFFHLVSHCLHGTSIPKIGCHYFWPGLIKKPLPNNTLCTYLLSNVHELLLWTCEFNFWSSLRDFGPPKVGNNNNRSSFIWGFLKDDILANMLKHEISYRVIIYLEGFLVSFRGFFWRLGIYFWMVKYLSFHNSSSFAFKIPF